MIGRRERGFRLSLETTDTDPLSQEESTVREADRGPGRVRVWDGWPHGQREADRGPATGARREI